MIRLMLLAAWGLVAASPLTAQEVLSPAPQGTFSIVVIPDTQWYLGKGTKLGNKLEPVSTDPITNPIFESYADWITENIDQQNIVFVSHVGDIVDEGSHNDHEEWKIARRNMDRIHGKIPYGISVGNHDMLRSGNSSQFQKYFPASRFEEFDWYGGCFSGSPKGPEISGNNANSYQLFSAGGMDFIFLHLECNAPDDVLEWANGILEQHSDRRALITTHMGYGPRVKPQKGTEHITKGKGRMIHVKRHEERGNTPQQLWEKCYTKHQHLFVVFSGDQSFSQALRGATPGDHGNIIHEILQDYKQASEQAGWLRLYRFYPAQNRIEAITFDPTTGELCQGTQLIPERENHQFEIEYEMHSP